MINILRAVGVAAMAHKGQVEIGSNDPYLMHPIRVAKAVARMGGSESEVIAAILHDAVEDSDLRVADVRDMFGSEVARLVDGLSHAKSEPYSSYLQRAMKAGAARIKVADVMDNIDIDRLSKVEEIDPARAERLRRKYARALLILSAVPVANQS